MTCKPQKIEQLEATARDMVGDGGTPNLFFVTLHGTVIMIARDGEAAHDYWVSLTRRNRCECALEDRQNGVICMAGTDEAGRWEYFDDFYRFFKG